MSWGKCILLGIIAGLIADDLEVSFAAKYHVREVVQFRDRSTVFFH